MIKYFKFTPLFMETNQEILDLFPELKLGVVYKVTDIEYISDDDNAYGITKIKEVESGAVFAISEIPLMDGAHALGSVPWCFLYTEFENEFEVVNDPS